MRYASNSSSGTSTLNNLARNTRSTYKVRYNLGSHSERDAHHYVLRSVQPFILVGRCTAFSACFRLAWADDGIKNLGHGRTVIESLLSRILAVTLFHFHTTLQELGTAFAVHVVDKHANFFLCRRVGVRVAEQTVELICSGQGLVTNLAVADASCSGERLQVVYLAYAVDGLHQLDALILIAVDLSVVELLCQCCQHLRLRTGNRLTVLGKPAALFLCKGFLQKFFVGH